MGGTEWDRSDCSTCSETKENQARDKKRDELRRPFLHADLNEKTRGRKGIKLDPSSPNLSFRLRRCRSAAPLIAAATTTSILTRVAASRSL